MALKQRFFVLVILLLLVGGAFVFWQSKRSGTPPSKVETMTPVELVKNDEKFFEPLPGAKLRMTKKPFGIYVEPGNSPIDPERFRGYHTGVDLEVTKAEEGREVPVYAFCNGRVLDAREADGYGGVLVTSCKVNGEPVAVLYGHLKFSSIKKTKVDEPIEPGEVIGLLGRGFSSETDGERKHLHFAIHRGEGFSLRGYVDREEQLAEWMDPRPLLP